MDECSCLRAAAVACASLPPPLEDFSEWESLIPRNQLGHVLSRRRYTLRPHLVGAATVEANVFGKSAPWKCQNVRGWTLMDFL
eukprot:1842780-Pyramimonas_sp.AAC.2